jgi:hypothetical protein
MSNKTPPKQLKNTLQMLLGSTRRIIRPDFTPKAFNKRPLGAPTGVSKEVVDASNAIRNQEINKEREEEAIAILKKKGFGDKILSNAAVKELVEKITNKKMR